MHLSERQVVGKNNHNPRVVFRTDGSFEIGMGHLRRCMSLARALEKSGATISFALYGDRHGAAIVQSEGYTLEWVAQRDFVIPAGDADCVVVDSYAMGEDHFRGFIREFGVTAVIDDLGLCPVPVDVVINQNLTGPLIDYDGRDDTLFLTGTKYALLRDVFAELAEKPTPRRSSILVIMGATDLHGQTAKIIRGLGNAGLDRLVEIVIGSGARTIEEVRQAAKEVGKQMAVHINPPDLPEIMNRAALAVSAGGVTVLELACLGVPTVLVTVAANQVEAAGLWQKNRFAKYVGNHDKVSGEDVATAVGALLNDPPTLAAMSEQGRKTVDGHGASRAAKALMDRIEKKL